MQLLDIDDTDFDVQSFSPPSNGGYGICILGIQIKNNYDSRRCYIPKKYKPKDILHYIHFPTTHAVYFRGISVQIKTKYLSLIEDLNQYTSNIISDISVNGYNAILKKYSISCSECYAYMKRGVYPINGNYLNEITTADFSLKELYREMLCNKKIPFYKSINYLSLYILNQPMYKKDQKNISITYKKN
jgi:hypothetical protein